jgi:cytochrome o ubiquinol oxidase subunit IV
MTYVDGDIEDGDTAPGDKHEVEGELGEGSIQSYVIGLALSTLLTVASFGLPATGLVWGPGVPVALAVLAVAQMGVHLVFFLHITTAPDNTNNVLALAFGVLVVGLLLAGSLFIMTNLNNNMLPMDEMMRMQRSATGAGRCAHAGKRTWAVVPFEIEIMAGGCPAVAGKK